jgi:serine/threonine protein kinase
MTPSVAEIVLAMCVLQPQHVIHGNPTSDNIILDWHWEVQICDFMFSVCPDQPSPSPPDRPGPRYAMGDLYNVGIFPENDVFFSLGKILHELITCQPGFFKDVTCSEIQWAMVGPAWKSPIPDNVIPQPAELIRDGVADEDQERPSFAEILSRRDRRVDTMDPSMMTMTCKSSQQCELET